MPSLQRRSSARLAARTRYRFVGAWPKSLDELALHGHRTYSRSTFLSQPAMPVDSLIEAGGSIVSTVQDRPRALTAVDNSKAVRCHSRMLRIESAELRLAAGAALARARKIVDDSRRAAARHLERRKREAPLPRHVTTNSTRTG